MPLDDVRDDDRDLGALGAPVRGQHPGRRCVQALADASAQQCVADLRKQIESELQLTPAGRAALDARLVYLFARLHTRDCLRACMRGSRRAETTIPTDDEAIGMTERADPAAEVEQRVDRRRARSVLLHRGREPRTRSDGRED